MSCDRFGRITVSVVISLEVMIGLFVDLVKSLWIFHSIDFQDKGPSRDADAFAPSSPRNPTRQTRTKQIRLIHFRPMPLPLRDLPASAAGLLLFRLSERMMRSRRKCSVSDARPTRRDGSRSGFRTKVVEQWPGPQLPGRRPGRLPATPRFSSAFIPPVPQPSRLTRRISHARPVVMWLTWSTTGTACRFLDGLPISRPSGLTASNP